MHGVVEEVDEALLDGLLPGDAPHLAHLLDDLHEALVVGRDLLAALDVVDLGAVVVGRVVGGRDVEAALGAQVTDGEGELGRGDEALAAARQDVHVHAVGGVDPGGQLGEVPGAQAHDRVGHARRGSAPGVW
ncbi:MAG: hypothetical protein H6740_01355 [Alphaproteobacteria bacterium]|nr:hypothetical protein [Alphaproteobacteria bacterium]